MKKSDDEHDALLLFPFLSSIVIGEQGTTQNNKTRISSRFIRAKKDFIEIYFRRISNYHDMLSQQAFDKHFAMIPLRIDHPVFNYNIFSFF